MPLRYFGRVVAPPWRGHRAGIYGACRLAMKAACGQRLLPIGVLEDTGWRIVGHSGWHTYRLLYRGVPKMEAAE